MVESLLGPQLVDIGCGDFHTLAVTASGECYSWGANSHGQLGISSFTSSSEPKLIKDLTHSSIESVSCGSQHTLFLSKCKEVYACGDGEAG